VAEAAIAILADMDRYCEVFAGRIKIKATTEAPSSGVVDDNNQQTQKTKVASPKKTSPKPPKKTSEELATEILARKTFFLLLYSLDSQTATWLHEALVELADYINVYLSDVQ
jgi:hypothetical protein